MITFSLTVISSYANGNIHHELLGETCTLVASSETGDLKCDEIWLSAVAAEWQIQSQGVWLCGQGHAPMSITEESCTTEGCSITKHDLPEVAANLWFAVASLEEEVLACESTSFNTSEAAKIFARVFSSGCGTHNVGFRNDDDKVKCLDCHYDDNLACNDNDDLNIGKLVIAEDMETDESNALGEEQQEIPDQATLVEGSKAIWRGNIFAKSKFIIFFDLVELAINEGLDPKFAGSHMSSWNIRDACWIYLLTKKRSANNNKGEAIWRYSTSK